MRYLKKLSKIVDFMFSPGELVKKLWRHQYHDIRLILEQTEELHYFHVSASAQRFLTRTLIVACLTLIFIILSLAIHSAVSVWRYDTLEASKFEADKKRQEALSAIAALSDKSIVLQENVSQDELLRLAKDYRERMDKMQILINFSSQELKLATQALEEGLRASGLGSNILQRIRSNEKSVRAGVGGNSEEITLNDASSHLLANYKNNLVQLEQIKRIYQSFPTKTPATQSIVTSKYGVRVHPITNKLTVHEVLDYVPTSDQNARAVIAGVVEKVEHSTTGYGNLVVLLHPNKVRTIYAHLDGIQVRQGQAVAEDEVLGKIGSTGFSTGKHLHYEISIDHVKVNPSIITMIAKNVQ